MSGKRGFTLIELLIVIAIISILAALLMPVLQRALATARQLQCASNQRQLALPMNQYADDYGHVLPWGHTGNPSGPAPGYPGNRLYNWFLAPYVEREDGSYLRHPTGAWTADDLGTNGLCGFDPLFQCPHPEAVTDRNTTGSTTWWYPQRVTYQANGIVAVHYDTVTSWRADQTRRTQLRNAAAEFVFVDGKSNQTYHVKFLERQFRPVELRPGDGIFFNAHNEGANVSFLDGHVQRLQYDPAENLWQNPGGRDVNGKPWP